LTQQSTRLQQFPAANWYFRGTV